MKFWNFWKRKSLVNKQLRIIKTVRGQKSIDNAIEDGAKLIVRVVEPFSVVNGKFCVIKNKSTGRELKIYDFRDERIYSDEFEIVKDWTYTYDTYDFPKEAAYVIPSDIIEDEIVIINDLIENFIEYQHNQGGTQRLRSCKAVWKNGDLVVLNNPENDRVDAVG